PPRRSRPRRSRARARTPSGSAPCRCRAARAARRSRTRRDRSAPRPSPDRAARPSWPFAERLQRPVEVRRAREHVAEAGERLAEAHPAALDHELADGVLVRPAAALERADRLADAPARLEVAEQQDG